MRDFPPDIHGFGPFTDEERRPEPFLALLAGAVSGYIMAIILTCVVFPAVGLSVAWGHFFLACAFAGLVLGLAIFKRIKRKWLT